MGVRVSVGGMGVGVDVGGTGVCVGGTAVGSGMVVGIGIISVRKCILPLLVPKLKSYVILFQAIAPTLFSASIISSCSPDTVSQM
jgi:hypothetical protein